MPFIDEPTPLGPFGLPKGFGEKPDDLEGSLAGAALRNSSPFFQEQIDLPGGDFDPEYRVWDDIVGTQYEEFKESFYDARTADDVNYIKGRIDSQIRDDMIIAQNGVMGGLADMGASLFSPTSLLPGGAVVKAAKGFSVAKSFLNVGAHAGAAAALDEAFLHGSQETRTLEESAINIGGSVVLGGLLGAGAGKLHQSAFTKISNQLDEVPSTIAEVHDSISSAGAMDVRAAEDFEIRREKVFKIMEKTGVLMPLVRADPLLRTQLSDLDEVRRTVSQLSETVLQYKANESGTAVTPGGSVEQVVNARRNTELAKTFSDINRSFGDYVFDREVGYVGAAGAPFSARFSNLTSATKKLTRTEYSNELGRALMSGDTHPIPQIDALAKQIRAEIFDPIKKEGVELGLWDEDMLPENAASYFMRVYKTGKIIAHRGDGSENDFSVALLDAFKKNRAEVEARLAADRTVDDLEVDILRNKENIRESLKAYKVAKRKAKDKESRAEATMRRQQAVGKVLGALVKRQKSRTDDLTETIITAEDRSEVSKMIRQARGDLRRKPPTLLQAIRDAGGLRKTRRNITGQMNMGNMVGPEDLIVDKDLTSALDGVGNIFRHGGRDADDMRELMAEAGYIDANASLNDFYDILRDAAGGKDIYSRQEFRAEIDAYEAANDFARNLEEVGLDLRSLTVGELLKLEGRPIARSQVGARAKRGEAGRAGSAIEKREVGAGDQVDKAIDRLIVAQDRLAELEDIVKPKVRAEIKAAREAIHKAMPELKKAQKKKATDEALVAMDDMEMKAAVDDAINSIIGIKQGGASHTAGLASPTRARVLNVADEILEPWLETDARLVLDRYFNSVIPEFEIARRFGDVHMTEAFRRIDEEVVTRLEKPKLTERQREKLKAEAENRKADLIGMRDRIRGFYGAPKDPTSFVVRGGRVSRTLSYMGLLGSVTIAAVPDIAGVVGRSTMEAVYGAANAKRLMAAAKGAGRDVGGAAEWFLNSRNINLTEVGDRHAGGTAFERGLNSAATGFSFINLMIPWNTAWKSISGATSSSRLLKAARASAEGKATKKQLIALSENNIEPWQATRIAEQFAKYGDDDGNLLIAQAGDWDDMEAFTAYRNAINREMGISIVTPGQDKPLTMSQEGWKFFTQFQTFAVAANHRILLSGIQRADASVLSQFSLALFLGMVVSNVRADIGGYERKEGSALFVDALDRSGLTGWLFQVDALANTMGVGSQRLTGELPSRFQSRSQLLGLAGPNVDFGFNAANFARGVSTGTLRQSDVNRLTSHVPGQNHPITRLTGATEAMREGLGSAFGAKP